MTATEATATAATALVTDTTPSTDQATPQVTVTKIRKPDDSQPAVDMVAEGGPDAD